MFRRRRKNSKAAAAATANTPAAGVPKPASSPLPVQPALCTPSTSPTTPSTPATPSTPLTRAEPAGGDECFDVCTLLPPRKAKKEEPLGAEELLASILGLEVDAEPMLPPLAPLAQEPAPHGMRRHQSDPTHGGYVRPRLSTADIKYRPSLRAQPKEEEEEPAEPLWKQRQKQRPTRNLTLEQIAQTKLKPVQPQAEDKAALRRSPHPEAADPSQNNFWRNNMSFMGRRTSSTPGLYS